MTDLTTTLNFNEWVTKNGPELKPPVANKEMFPGGDDFIVMVVGGPNSRTDYHVDPFEEVFYQVKGTMHVDLMTADGPERVTVGAGEMWVLPRLMPHSPQRPEAGSIGLVFERVRNEGTLEKFHRKRTCAACTKVPGLAALLGRSCPSKSATHRHVTIEGSRPGSRLTRAQEAGQ